MADEDLDRRHAERGADRLIYFSDAVVAIAITLVVLPLVDEAGGIGHETVGEFFRDDFYGFLAAAVSFYSIARFWQTHHQLFVRLVGYTKWLVQVNMLWLAGIVFLPLATVLDVKQRTGAVGGTVLYVLTLAYLFAMGRVLELVVIHEGLLDDHPPMPGLRETLAHWSPIGLLVVAAIVVVAWSDAGLYPLFLLLLSGPVSRLVRGRPARRPEER